MNPAVFINERAVLRYVQDNKRMLKDKRLKVRKVYSRHAVQGYSLLVEGKPVKEKLQ